MISQTIESKKGEIEFRKKLVQQQVYSKKNFNDEFNKEEIERIIKERMANTFQQLSVLKNEGILAAPYVEIGSERCQRSLVVENDLGVRGFSIDISYDMLKSCDYYRTVFNRNKNPVRICCDANNLPFLSKTVPFVFCYQTLHHFPEPRTITREIYRILKPGGHFFFDEESYKKILHINLYKRKKIYSQDSLKKSNFRKILDHFFAELNCNELIYGIIENDDISTAAWKEALKFFEQKEVKLCSGGLISAELFNPKHFLRYLAAYLLGGKISGMCRKEGELFEKKHFTLDILACPECMDAKIESRLTQKSSFLICGYCGAKFPVLNEVIFLFSYKKLKELYPDVAAFQK